MEIENSIFLRLMISKNIIIDKTNNNKTVASVYVSRSGQRSRHTVQFRHCYAVDALFDVGTHLNNKIIASLKLAQEQAKDQYTK